MINVRVSRARNGALEDTFKCCGTRPGYSVYQRGLRVSTSVRVILGPLRCGGRRGAGTVSIASTCTSDLATIINVALMVS